MEVNDGPIKPREIAEAIDSNRKRIYAEIQRLCFERTILDATIEAFAASSEGRFVVEFRHEVPRNRIIEFERRMDEAGIEAIYCEPACPSMGDKAYWRLLLK